MKYPYHIIGALVVLMLSACSTQYMDGISHQENPSGNTAINGVNDGGGTNSLQKLATDATHDVPTTKDAQLDALRTSSSDLATDAGTSMSAQLSTPEDGTLVAAPDQTTISSIDKPTGAQDAVVAATVATSEDADTFTLLVFNKEPAETLTTWSEHHSTGDSFVPTEQVQTHNGKTAYIYTSNDFGLVPDIHVVIVSDSYVYQLRYNDDWGDDSVEAAHRAEADEAHTAQVKNELTRFVQTIDVK